jgi:hypothetical protein
MSEMRWVWYGLGMSPPRVENLVKLTRIHVLYGAGFQEGQAKWEREYIHAIIPPTGGLHD